MTIEVEVKFKVKDFTAIRRRLKQLGAKKIGQAFQRALLFDFSDRSLKRKHQTLRLRTGFKNELTFKHKKSRTAQFKTSQEIETQVENPEVITKIFHHLGLKPHLILEKNRQSWTFNGVEIELDELPFGNYVELEGPPQKSKQVAQKLNLDFSQGISDSYPRLYRKWCRRVGIKPGQIIFTNSKIAR